MGASTCRPGLAVRRHRRHSRRHVLVCPKCRGLYVREVRVCGLDGTALKPADRDPLVGEALDRYHIESRLGIGGMGCVYRARHHVLERWYAIKVLFGDFSADEKFQARFRREAQSMSRVRHPNVISVEDFGTTPGGLTYLAMELIEGETLEQTIASYAPIPPQRTASLMRQIARGLQAAHERDLVHRDVKPSNIMVYREDGRETIKLLDFGAVGLRAAPQETRLTSVGHIIGTPTYMAPEQTNDAAVTPSADLYALGVVAYEMVTGAPPFEGERRAEVLVRHITEQPAPLPNLNGLGPLVMRLLAKKPVDRPPGARELVTELDALLSRLAEPTEILQRRASVSPQMLELADAQSKKDEADTLLGHEDFGPLIQDHDDGFGAWGPEVLTPANVPDPALRPPSHVSEEAPLTDPEQSQPNPVLFEPARPSNAPVNADDEDSETQVDYDYESLANLEGLPSPTMPVDTPPLNGADGPEEVIASSTVLDTPEDEAQAAGVSRTVVDADQVDDGFDFPPSEIQVAADSMKAEFSKTLPASVDLDLSASDPTIDPIDTQSTPEAARPTLPVESETVRRVAEAAQTLQADAGPTISAPAPVSSVDDDDLALVVPSPPGETKGSGWGRLFWVAIVVLSLACVALGWMLLERRGYIELDGETPTA
ncbi:Serine/threonine protein kinase (fragment) Endoplasmic reticulum membrane, partial [Chondrus crispus]